MADSFLPPVVAVLTASISDFQAKMVTAKGEMEGVEGTAAGMSTLGKAALLGLAAGAAAVGYETVKMATNFNSQMELIATQAHAPQDEVDALKQKVLDLAPAVGIGPEKLAEGLYHIESTGIRGQQAMDILTASAKDAQIGIADLDTVAFAMSGVMSVSMKDVRDAADGVAYLNTIVGTGDMKMQGLADAIGTGVLPVFKTAGLGMTDFGAALSTLTDNATPPTVAANHLKTAIQLLQNQSGPATKALAEIGIGSGQLANDLQKPDGLLVAIQDVKTHLEASGKTAAEQGQIMSKAFGGARGAATIETLVGEIDKLKSKYQDMGTEAQRQAQFQQDWADTQEQFRQKMQEVGAQFQTWAIEIGNVLLPALGHLADGFLTVVNFLSTHQGVLVAIGSGLLPLLAMGLWALVTATWAWTIALLANPITWIVLAFAALGFAIYELVTHWKQVSAFLSGAWNAFINWAIGVWNGFLGFWRDLGRNIGTFARDAWRDASDWAQQKVDEVVGWLHDRWSDFLNFWRDLGRNIGDSARNAWTDLMNWLGGIPGQIQGRFADAGNWLVSAGGNLLIGLYNGIVSMAGWLYNQVVSWAESIVNGIKSALGISSPSKETYEHGRYLAEGLAAGLDDHAHVAAAAASRMASSVLGAANPGGLNVTGSGSLAMAPAGAGGTVVIVNVAGSVLAERDLQRQIQESTLRYNMRNSGNGLTLGVA